MLKQRTNPEPCEGSEPSQGWHPVNTTKWHWLALAAALMCIAVVVSACSRGGVSPADKKGIEDAVVEFYQRKDKACEPSVKKIVEVKGATAQIEVLLRYPAFHSVGTVHHVVLEKRDGAWTVVKDKDE